MNAANRSSSRAADCFVNLDNNLARRQRLNKSYLPEKFSHLITEKFSGYHNEERNYCRSRVSLR
jgi:hypothetical protein